MRIVNPVRFLFLLIAILLAVPCQQVSAYELKEEDRRLLEKIEQDTLRYFVRMSDKFTGFTRDSSRTGSPSSIAATGFALAAVAIGQSRGWIDEEHAQEQLRKTLKAAITKAQQEKGFFYHFLDSRTGRRVWESEISSIDTALFIAGALVAAQYNPGTDIERMAQDLYLRVDWPWMLNNSLLVCLGWKPESGFLPYYWDTYNEHLIIQALAIGSPSHPIPREAWNEWARYEDTYGDKKIVYAHSGSLFTYQYPHAFIDFRNLNDQGINYFENSKKAVLINREYSLSFRSFFSSYSEDSWGLSACVGPGGYKAYGSRPGMGFHDGTIAPYAAISSIVFTPELSVKAARFFYDNYASQLYGPFGFRSSFNLDKNWWSDEYLGIDQGVTVLMLENFLNDGAVWKKFMSLKPIQHWIERCNLKSRPAEATPSS